MASNMKPVTGTVHEKNGSWHAVLNVTDFETGKRKTKWKKIGKATKKRGDGGLTKKQAESFLPKIVVEEEKSQEEKHKEYSALLLKEGWSIKHIQHWLRHSDAQTTAKFYLHTDEEELLRVGAGVEDMYNKFTTKKEITK